MIEKSKKEPSKSLRSYKGPSKVAKKNVEPKETVAVVKEKTTRIQKKTPVKIIPLGGLLEIGKNMTVIECSNDMFIIDCGMAFPTSDMPGVDLVIPDFTYVERNIEKLRGIVLTHGHEDHIGALAYFLKKFNTPIYGSRLTLALVNSKLKEHNLDNVELIERLPRQTIKMGCMGVELIQVNHSIPDAVGLAIHTPAGVIIHTGDFKVDYTPINGNMIDLARFSELGSKGVLALMADSTNAERPGFTPTERLVGDTFKKLFTEAEGRRIIIATFSSNIHRIQQIINYAVRFKRKVAVLGRSMVNVISIARELGYLNVADEVLIDVEMLGNYPPEKIVLITTGTQGEPMSALTRMSTNSHRSVSITPMDYIIISATPIPGNEKYVTKVINDLMRVGAHVVYEKIYEVHVSGHACQEELKLMLALTKPRFFIPVHGEFKHLKKHAELAYDMGIPKENVILADIGDVIETNGADMNIVNKVPAGRVLVDGSRVGDIGTVVLKDRTHLAKDGMIAVAMTVNTVSCSIISGPEIISRGFVYVNSAEELMKEAKELLEHSFDKCHPEDFRDWNLLKNIIRNDLSDFVLMKTKRRPMILPIIMEVCQ